MAIQPGDDLDERRAAVLAVELRTGVEERSLSGVREAMLVAVLGAPLDHAPDGQAERAREGVVALVVHGHRHERAGPDRKSTRLNSSHSQISYAVFCLKKKN